MPAPASEAAVEVAGVTRWFRVGLRLRRETALDDVRFTARRGTTLGLVGPNGSGKSTLLRILAGVDRPSRGAARVVGLDPTHREARRRSTFLPDGAPYPAELSARGALELVAALQGLPRTARRAAAGEMLERVGLGDRARSRLATFSRGMHRRFGLAQAFLGEPDVVLLDEPTAGLDAPGFGVLDDLLRGARARGATVVIASHVPSDLVDHCDDLVLLVRGRVARSGTPDELLGREGRVDLAVDVGAVDAERIRDAVEATGARVTAMRPARRPLTELYGAGPEPDA